MASSTIHDNDLYMDDIDMEDVAITPETWTSPLPPGIWDMDMDVKTSSSPPAPPLTSFGWQHTEHIAYTSPLFGLGLFPRSHSPVSKVGIPAEPDNTWPTACTSPAVMSPAPTHGLLHAPNSNSPASVSSPTLLRAPRLAPRELLQSRNASPVPTHSPLMRSPPPSPIPHRVPPVEGTRPPVPRHFSALGLDFSAVPTSTRQPPSPPASLSEGHGRRRPRTPALDDDDDDDCDRGRSRLRMSDTNSRRLKPKRTPRATVQRATSDYTELNSRVHVWRGAVADAAATPYCAGDSSFPDDHWAEVLASTCVATVPIPNRTSPPSLTHGRLVLGGPGVRVPTCPGHSPRVPQAVDDPHPPHAQQRPRTATLHPQHHASSTFLPITHPPILPTFPSTSIRVPTAIPHPWQRFLVFPGRCTHCNL